jgi:hypothetical protein
MRLRLLDGGIDGDEIRLMNEMDVLFQSFNVVKIMHTNNLSETTPFGLKLSHTMFLILFQTLGEYARYDRNYQCPANLRKSSP